ncbi:MAG: putative lipase/esterase protein [Amycolatopsis sp.]|jgi:acetyl esterase/lipase|uniref:alpha/beta hydrolase n=1 Tax=Amycolatopsis sp. TaxID=37632 RepID=UPI00262C456B|nr:alpha/beta hydrolase [Amycolatopsis sp.]MCU1682935.1 putative lipase/esterase protein [Amycolatopsis sp.]
MTRPGPGAVMAPLDYRRLVPLAMLEPPAVSVLPGAVSHLQIPYAEALGWRPLRLDLHLPAAASARRHPVVVYVHGGSFLTGMPGMGPWAGLPGHGIAVASVAYRLSGEACFPAPVEDVRAALAWVGAQGERYGLDGERVAVWGSSAGGYLAAMAAVTGATNLSTPPRLLGVSPSETESRPAAVVTHYAVTAPELLREDAYQNSEAEIRGLEAIMGGFFDDSAKLLTAVADHLGEASAMPSFLLMHGDADRRVGLGQSRRLHDALTAAGASSELVVVPGGDHGSPHFTSEPVVARVEDFLWQSWGRSSTDRETTEKVETP